MFVVNIITQVNTGPRRHQADSYWPRHDYCISLCL